MNEVKPYKVGVIKSIFRDSASGELRGVLETINDDDNDLELPFVITNPLLIDIKQGKMVKFVKERGTVISRAVDVDKL